MRAFLVAVLCSGAMLGRVALADPAQPETSAVPSTPAQTEYSAPSTAPVQGQTAAPVAPAAVAPTAAAPAAAQSTSAQINLDEVVCRQTAPATGTRLGGGRECHTARQWRDRQIESERALQQQQRVGFSGSGS
jgi:type V secretory pathway adhesin AidA